MAWLHLTHPPAPSAVRLLGGDSAGQGELVTGVEGLLDRLELELGIPPAARWLQRVLELLRGGHTPSDANPVGGAVAALRLADALRDEGVTPSMLPARWRAALGAAMAVRGGVADRVDRIAGRLGRHATRGSVVLHVEESRLPGKVRHLIGSLGEYGWSVTRASNETRRTALPTVTLVRGPSPLAVATSVVECVARGAGREVVWVAPDTLVDRALAARGLPLTGARGGGHPFRGVLGRVVALAFSPQDPADVLDLLTTPALPLPRGVARRLCDALQAWPSWHSKEWADACRESADATGAPPAALAWLSACLAPLSGVAGALAVALRARVSVLAALLRERAGPFDDAAADACDGFCGLLDAWDATTVDRALLQGMVDLAESGLPETGVGAPQVGALALPSLAAVVAPVGELVVWDAAAPPHDPFALLLDSERDALRAAGASVPSRRTLLARWQEDAERAVSLTGGLVWLCLPDANAEGAPLDDPPWLPRLDAWLRASGGAGIAPHRPAARTAARIAPPRARTRWTVPAERLHARAKESPSSAMTLLGCPLRHALRYEARLGEPFAPELPGGGLLRGRLAHVVFEDVWGRSLGALPADAVGERLRESFEREVDLRALTLALPSARAERLAVREAIARAGEALAASLRDAGMHVAGCEVPLGEGLRLGGASWTARADLVLGPAPVVLDLKWSGALHRAALAQGTAVQLALYAWMLRGREDVEHDGAWPAAGYLVVTGASLVATPGSPLRVAEPVAGPVLAGTVAAVGRRMGALAAERERGELAAPGALSERPRAGLRDGELTLEPPCGGCAHASLCGRGLAG